MKTAFAQPSFSHPLEERKIATVRTAALAAEKLLVVVLVVRSEAFDDEGEDDDEDVGLVLRANYPFPLAAELA